MEKRKLSPKYLLKQISYKKHLKDKETLLLGELKVCKEDFEIENMDFPHLSNSNKTKAKTKTLVTKEIGYGNLKKLLDNTSSSQISDALSNISKRNGVIDGLKSINNKKAYGRIVTVKTSSDDWGTCLYGIDEAKKGNILFIETSGESSAIWGELTSSCSKEKELAGTFILGAVRDIDFLKNFDYPIFAKESVPNAGSALGLGEINMAIEIEKNEKITINPGDFVYGDENGVVHIPQELFCEVMLETLKIKVNESHILSEIKKGKPLSEIVGLK
ncbi:MAG: RraA family protein [Methanobrevibacter sp.]|nr:RraA family protein [Methanobrevibacter sp.]